MGLMMQLAAHPEWLPLLLDEEGNQEPFDCADDGQGGGGTSVKQPAAPRRAVRKRSNQGGPAEYPFGMGGMPGLAGMGEFPDPFGGRGGKGKGRGKRGKGGGMGRYPDPAAHAAYAGAGVPMMPMPVMTEHGLQYMPYDGGYGGSGGFMVYPAMDPSQFYAMPYGLYPGMGAYGEGGAQEDEENEEEGEEEEDGLLHAM